jgi:LPXTG-motif cell wall-anchored protein
MMDGILIAGVSELIVSNLPLILMGVFAAIAALLGLFIRRRRKKHGEDDIWAEVAEAFASGVSDSQEEVVTFAKRAAADGKLSKEERKEAVEHAMNVAKDVATGEAGKRIAQMGLAEGRKWVGRVLSGRKKGMAETNAKTAEAKVNDAQAKIHEATLKQNTPSKPETGDADTSA